MATIVITITTPDSDAFIQDQLQLTGSSPFTITAPNTMDRVARLIDGYAVRTWEPTTFTVALS